MSNSTSAAAILFYVAAFGVNAVSAGEAPCISKPDVLKSLSNDLKNPDPMTRIATINAMLESCDPAQREIAYERGFASPEQAVRALALRGKLRTTKTLILEIAPAVEGNKGALDAITRWGSHIEMPVRAFDAMTGQLTLAAGSSTVSGTRLSLNYGQCRGPLELGDGAVLKGTITCGTGVVKAAIQL